MSTIDAVTIFYFGADGTWQEIRETGFHRRNTCLIKSLCEHRDVAAVCLVHPVPWRRLLSGSVRKSDPTSKVHDVFLPLFPGCSRFTLVSRLNSFTWRWMLTAVGFDMTGDACCLLAYWYSGLKLALKLAGNLPIIFDADHNIIDDVNFDSADVATIRSLLVECRSRPVLGITASRSMLRHFSDYTIPSARLRNGVEPERFTNPRGCPPQLSCLPRPVIGYVGTLSRWLDLDLLGDLASRKSEWSFVVIGATYKRDIPEKIWTCQNIHFIGPKSAGEVPAYLAHFDCALNLYRCDCQNWMDPDSMKLFEYIAAGVPVVSTPFHQELQEDFAGLVATASDREGICRHIERIIERSDAERASWQSRALSFTHDNTWRLRGDEVVALCQQRIAENRKRP